MENQIYKMGTFLEDEKMHPHDREHNLKYLEQHNVIFLDIDGVIEPYNNDRRFAHKMRLALEYLIESYNAPVFRKMDVIDVMASYYDWSYIGVGIIHELAERMHCKIVFHSAWRDYVDVEGFKALLRMYNMEEYVEGSTESGMRKAESIKKYLSEHPEIDNYVVIDDDLDLVYQLGSKLCNTWDMINIDDYEIACSILNTNYLLEVDEENKKVNFTYDIHDRNWSFTYVDVDMEDGKKLRILFPSYMTKFESKLRVPAFYKDMAKWLYEHEEVAGIILFSGRKDVMWDELSRLVKKSNHENGMMYYMASNFCQNIDLMELAANYSDEISGIISDNCWW